VPLSPEAPATGPAAKAPGPTAPARTGTLATALLVVLALAVAGNVILLLLPGPGALLPAFAELWRDVITHDSEALRRAHDGWYRRLLPACAALEAQVPPGAAVVLRAIDVPPWFVVARFPGLRFFDDAPAVRAELLAREPQAWLLVLRNGEPVGFELLPLAAAAPDDAPDDAPR
jgi:hypothetical protein